MTRVASNPFTIQVQSATGQTGLNFPSNGAAPTNVPVAFQFLNPQQNGLPIWGPSNQGVTYIWRCNYRQQSSYYTAFFWGNYGNYIWDGGGANTYYGAHPYPINPPNGNTHNWEISVQWIDHQNTRAGNTKQVVYQQWFTQALRVTRNLNGSKTLIFYTNLPSTANADVLEFTTVADFGNTNPPNPALTWGDSPWEHSPGQERLSGILRGIKIFNRVLSEPDTVAESQNNALVTAAGQANIWWMKINPRPDDLLCDAGTGRNPVWATSARPTLWTG